MEKKVIPTATKYSIDAEGNVTNNKKGTPVFPQGQRVNLYSDAGPRIPFDIPTLVKKLHGVELVMASETNVAKEELKKEVAADKKATTKKETPKAETVAPIKIRGTIINEIQSLFTDGKDRDDVLKLNKYNKSTVNVQWGKYKAAQTAKK